MKRLSIFLIFLGIIFVLLHISSRSIHAQTKVNSPRIVTIQTSKQSNENTTYVGNKRTKKLHDLAHSVCQNYVNRMNEENKIYFDSLDVAQQSGYELCKLCPPIGQTEGLPTDWRERLLEWMDRNSAALIGACGVIIAALIGLYKYVGRKRE